MEALGSLSVIFGGSGTARLWSSRPADFEQLCWINSSGALAAVLAPELARLEDL